ncbi:cytochrome P450 [Aspergillus avenaceus]|uniref:Cytochrome P450 n=1 Tax=Aspergillus avenaceus TaxID=36643 RepID=A0A5N6U8F7_ASPAV|nr:cytochrome P450 [Aspergillus avenaceus]
MYGLAIAVFLALLIFLRIFSNYTRLQRIPGPLVTGLTGLWSTYERNTPGFGRRLTGLHQQYGKVVRLGPHCVSVSDPTVIFPIRNSRPLEKSIFEYGAPGSVDGFHAIGAQDHSMTTRQTCLGTALQYEGIIDRSANNLIQTIRRHPLLQMTAFLRWFAADFVNHLTTGNTVQHMPAEAVGYQSTTPGNWSILENTLLNSSIARLRRSRDLSIGRLFHKVNQEGHLTPAHHGVSESYDNGQEALRSITTAFAVIFPVLLQHPGIMTKLRNEIDNAFDNGSLSDLPCWQELSRLRYLDAALKETLRTFSNTNHTHEIPVPPEGAIASGHYIPPETIIECHSEALKNDQGVYGENIHIFQPERWLNADVRRRRSMVRNLLPFSIEINRSPTVRVVWLELKKIVVLILLNFQVGFLSLLRYICIFLANVE